MGVDKITKPNHINIVVDDKPSVLKRLREIAESDGQNECLKEDECKKLSITDSFGEFVMEEYYFGDACDDNQIVMTGYLNDGINNIFISFSIPLSDVLLIDILSYSIKRFNKLKATLEALN